MNGKKARQIRQAKAGEVTWVPGLGYVSTDGTEAASERDRVYFAAHPDAAWYVRERMEREFPDKCSPLFTHTLVHQRRPGVRYRRSITEQRAHDLAALRAAGVEVLFPEDEEGRSA